ncbi:hypothetical protein [uncultured Anaerovibrio sp.]|uniref:hypothetical protein n=1 Tax=uncultured Anaerovibrio sp. TaxID=361586 RepID=UPI0025FB1986|nr:hypothetical protein [uncultured Anaerovibrio sp.]
METMNNRSRQIAIWKKYIKHHYFPIHELTDEVMAKLVCRESGLLSDEIIDLLDADTLEEFLALDIEELKKWGYDP